MHREPKVPEAEVPMEKCFECPARIISKELAPIHSVNNGILQYACSASRRMDADFGKSALMRIARLTNRSKPTLAKPTLAKPTLAKPTLAKPTLANPTLAKPTLAKFKVLVVCKDFGFWELIVLVF